MGGVVWWGVGGDGVGGGGVVGEGMGRGKRVEGWGNVWE